MNPSISVLMATYNVQLYVREAIESILDQSFKSFQFVIIDDHSTDATYEIIQSYKDPRIVLRRLPQNAQRSGALNIGISLAKGKYLAYMDADDISHKERLQILYDYLESHPQVDVVGSKAMMIDKKGTHIDLLYDYKGMQCHDTIMYHYLWGSSIVAHPSTMIRMSKIREYIQQYNEDIYTTSKGMEDREAYIKLYSTIGLCFNNIDQVLYYHRRHDQSISYIYHSKIILQINMIFRTKKCSLALLQHCGLTNDKSLVRDILLQKKTLSSTGSIILYLYNIPGWIQCIYIKILITRSANQVIIFITS